MERKYDRKGCSTHPLSNMWQSNTNNRDVVLGGMQTAIQGNDKKKKNASLHYVCIDWLHDHSAFVQQLLLK
jgi:hypothetical protein